MSGPTKRYYKDLTRISRALALSSDVAMATLGGDLKRKEMISARLGDGLSFLYMASAVLKKYEDEGRQQSDLVYVDYSIQHCLYRASQALQETYTNFPNRIAGHMLSVLVFPLGNRFKKPADQLSVKIAESLMTPGAHRDRLTHLCYVGVKEDDAVGLMERAFIKLYSVRGLERKLIQGVKDGKVVRKGPLVERLQQALEAGVLTQKEVDQINEAEALRSKAIQVDHFSHDFSEVKTYKQSEPKLNSVA